MYIHTYIHTYVCVCVYIYIYIHTYTYIYTFILYYDTDFSAEGFTDAVISPDKFFFKKSPR
jgi:hypothetical protein